MASTKAKLSAAMLSLIAAGASAPMLFDQFISEKEGNGLVAVMDPGGVWSLCHGVTVIDGKRVVKGMTATKAQCKKVNAIARDRALAWVDQKYQGSTYGPPESWHCIFLSVQHWPREMLSIDVLPAHQRW